LTWKIETLLHNKIKEEQMNNQEFHAEVLAADWTTEESGFSTWHGQETFLFSVASSSRAQQASCTVDARH
jgi:hypothetical protein